MEFRDFVLAFRAYGLRFRVHGGLSAYELSPGFWTLGYLGLQIAQKTRLCTRCFGQIAIAKGIWNVEVLFRVRILKLALKGPK